jgi:hypothetical protein
VRVESLLADRQMLAWVEPLLADRRMLVWVDHRVELQDQDILW